MTEHFDFKGINLIKSFYCTVPTNNWGIAWIKCIQQFLILYRTYSSVVSRSTDLYFCILISLLSFHILYFLLWTKMSWGGFVICWSDGTTGSTVPGSTANGAPSYIRQKPCSCHWIQCNTPTVEAMKNVAFHDASLSCACNMASNIFMF